MKYIDVSEHQGVIDWEKVKGNVDGVIIRAGYGRGNADKQFQRNISECNRLNIPAGIYWFSYAYTPDMAEKEAEYCLAAIKGFRVELPVCFDWEYDSVSYAKSHGMAVTPTLANALVREFCGAVEAAGYYAMNYANPDFLNRYFTDVAQYDLWLASWPKVVDVSKPPRKCGIWQWGGSAVPGISGNVDSNEAYKDYRAIIAKAGLNHLPKRPWYADAMDWALDAGVITEERPQDAATRAEVVQMIYNYNRIMQPEDNKRFSGLLEEE